jgi:hypothetical protein
MNIKKHSLPSGLGPLFLLLFACVLTMGQLAAQSAKTLEVRVKHVYGDAVYLEAGSSAGLSEGMRLTIKRGGQAAGGANPAVIAEIEIESVTLTSSAAKIVSSKSDITPGDIAYLTDESQQKMKQEATARELQKYAQVVSFTEGSPPEQEARESIPKPKLPEINRVRGRLGVDYSALQIPGSGNSSSQFGFTLRLDAARLGGSHWNMSGYHRGRIQLRKDPAQQTTLADLINRTYTLSLNYDNPSSRWVAGAGRLYVPWATSLSTIDGFYLGRRYGKETLGVFGGTTPNPTSWNYDSNRQLAGVFVNTERGSFDKFRFTSTSGIAVSRIHWQPDRQFGFFENGIYYKQFLSVYSNIEADFLTGSQNSGKQELALSRSYLTVRLQPHKAISFDINENYFRNIPTFDTRLIGTGLVDKYLFQGLSGGFRLTLPSHFGIYANAGRSSRTGDQRPSWNYLGGAMITNILHSGLRAEYRFSRFDGSFGRGTYQSVSASREMGEGFRFEVQAGQQALESSFTSQSRARFINGNLDWYMGAHYFLGVGLTFYRGQVQSYNQYFFNLGYRFDNRRRSNK